MSVSQLWMVTVIRLGGSPVVERGGRGKGESARKGRGRGGAGEVWEALYCEC